MKSRSLVIFTALLLPLNGFCEDSSDVFNLFSFEKEQPVKLIADEDDFFEEDFFETDEIEVPVVKATPSKAAEVLPVAQMPLKEEPAVEIPALAEIPVLVEIQPAAKIIDLTPTPIETAAQEIAPAKQEEPVAYKIIPEKPIEEKKREIASANIL